jgi:hypothetical protein
VVAEQGGVLALAPATSEEEIGTATSLTSQTPRIANAGAKESTPDAARVVSHPMKRHRASEDWARRITESGLPIYDDA